MSTNTKEISSETTKVISLEMAKKEVESWLNFKRVKPAKRLLYKDNIDKLAESIAEGTLVLTKEFDFIQHLSFEIGEEMKIETFKFKARVSVDAIGDHLKKVKGNDIVSMTKAYICALTNQPSEVVGKLDTEDYSVASSIALFFL